jgi:hypothetical protein
MNRRGRKRKKAEKGSGTLSSAVQVQKRLPKFKKDSRPLFIPLLLINVINKQSFGWTIQFMLPMGVRV